MVEYTKATKLLYDLSEELNQCEPKDKFYLEGTIGVTRLMHDDGDDNSVVELFEDEEGMVHFSLEYTFIRISDQQRIKVIDYINMISE